MKRQNMNSAKITQIKSFLARGLKPALLATAILFLAAALPALAGTGNAGNPGILPPQSHAYGKTYAEWSVNYWQWVLSLPATNSPILDTGDCSAGQSGPVWFLAGTIGCTTNTRSCTIPAGVALFFPTCNGFADNTDCPSSDTFSLEQLAGFASGFVESSSGMSCTIDGVPVKGLDDPITSPYRVGPQVFSYTLASTDNIFANFFGLACIPDGITVATAAEDGVYLLLAPLSAGQHTIHYTIESCHHDVTYHLTVN